MKIKLTLIAVIVAVVALLPVGNVSANEYVPGADFNPFLFDSPTDEGWPI